MFKIETTSRWGGARANSGPKPRVAPAIVRHDPPRWYCVRTAVAAEQIADAEIWLAGFEGFWPTVWCPATKARRLPHGAMRPARPDRVVPMFRRYGFVRFRRADPWQRIRGLAGVDGILGTAPDTPVPMPDAAMSRLLALCGGTDCQYPRGVDIHDLHAPVGIEVGATVRMLAGAMIDHIGVCEWSDAIEMRVGMNVLGRDVSFPVPRGWVEAA